MTDLVPPNLPALPVPPPAPPLPPEPNGAEPLTPANLGGRLVRAAPGLVRLAATSSWHLFEWSFKASVDTGREVVQSLASGNLPIETFRGIAVDLRQVGRQALGLTDDSEQPLVPVHLRPVGLTAEELRARGAELLYRSADVWFTEDVHPAYERILGEMAPDEARILRFLATDGPQPAIDVRTGRPLGIGSELIAGGLSMIGLRSGVRDMGRASAYQNNLFRLGLIWFSREEVDPERYQVVEVQPDVAAAIKQAGRMAKVVRRSIHLTPFGEDFCRTCLPIAPEAYWTGPQLEL
ncbi:MAG TPA: Abi-alpha family protein [Acidimicrobiales bacterium]|jgi:hypothetical protein|nr:Abi-alpha family protein [Acidimicrobiales bacterium]